MDKGLISDLLKTPSQIRKENDQRRLTEGLAMAQLAQQGNTLGGVGGMFANFGAQQAAQTGRNISNAFRGVTDAIGTVTGADLRPADERAAGQAQALARSIDMKDPASIRAGADKMRQFNPKAAEALEGRATALEAKLSASATAAEQTRYDRIQERLNYLLEERKVAVTENRSAAEIAKLDAQTKELEALLDPTIVKAKADAETAVAAAQVATGSINADIALAKANAKKAGIGADFDEQTFSTRINQLSANLDNTLANTSMTSVQQDQLEQSIKQAAETFPVEMAGLLEGNIGQQLTNELAKEQLRLDRQLTPLEVQKAAAQVKLLGADFEAQEALTEKRKRELIQTTNPTAYQKEVSAMVANGSMTQEEANQLQRRRIEAQSATGGVAGYNADSAINEARLGEAIRISQTGTDAVAALSRVNKIVSIIPDITSGNLREARSKFNQIASNVFGIGQDTAAADQLFEVLRGEMLLEKAGALKGALSDKDLQFLQGTLPDGVYDRAATTQAFVNLAAGYAGEAYAAQVFDKNLLRIDKNVPVSTIETAAQAFGQMQYLQRQKDAGVLPADFNINSQYDAGVMATIAQYSDFVIGVK